MAKRTDDASAAKAEESVQPPAPTNTVGGGKPAAPTFAAKIMYLGPSIAEEGMLYPHGQIFNNGLPLKWLEKAVEEPDFRLLLAPFHKIPKARLELADAQSMLSLAYKRLIEKYRVNTKEAK